MPRSYRHVAIAFGLALQPITNCSYAQTGTSDGQSHPTQAQQQIAPIDLTPINESLKAIDKRLEALKPDPESADEYRRAEGDLQAQSDMAFWAKWMTYATGISVFVSSLGVGLLIATLRQNQRTMRIAMLGVKHSDQAIKLQRNTSERELRAYLTFSEGTVTCNNEGLMVFAIAFQNTGQTPAYDLKAKGLCSITPESSPPSFSMQALEQATGDMSIVGQGQRHIINIIREFDGDDINYHRLGLALAYAWGEIIYTDAFSKQRYFRFRLQSGAPVLKGDEKYGLPPTLRRLNVHKNGCEAD